MRHSITLILAAAAALSVAGCNGSGSSIIGGSGAPAGQARFVNAISDSTPLTASVTGSSISLPNVAFLTDSGLLDEPVGSYTVQIQPTSGGNDVNLTMNTVHVDENAQTTLYALGAIAAQNLKALAVERQVTTVPSGMTEVQFVDTTTTSNGPHMGIFIAPPGQPLGSEIAVIESPTAGTGHPAYSPLPLNVPHGKMQIVIKSMHENGVVIFDTGSDGIDLPDGGSLQFAIVDAPGAQPSPQGARVQLLVLDNNGGTTQVLQNTAH
jgi:hypothetical protein